MEIDPDELLDNDEAAKAIIRRSLSRWWRPNARAFYRFAAKSPSGGCKEIALYVNGGNRRGAVMSAAQANRGLSVHVAL